MMILIVFCNNADMHKVYFQSVLLITFVIVRVTSCRRLETNEDPIGTRLFPFSRYQNKEKLREALRTVLFTKWCFVARGRNSNILLLEVVRQGCSPYLYVLLPVLSAN